MTWGLQQCRCCSSWSNCCHRNNHNAVSTRQEKRGSAKRIRKRRIKYTNDTEQVVAVVGRICYIHQPRSKKVCLPLNYARCLTVHILSVLCPRNCLHLILTAYVRVFGPCFNIFLNLPIPCIKLILLFSELIFSSTCLFPQHNSTLELRGQPVLSLCSAFLLGQYCHYTYDFQFFKNRDTPVGGLSILAIEVDHFYTSKVFQKKFSVVFVGRDLKDDLVSIPQPGLEHLQEWVSTISLCNMFQCFTILKEFLCSILECISMLCAWSCVDSYKNRFTYLCILFRS